MTIAYYSNFINHHQANVSDELYKLTDEKYTFVELCPIYDWLLKGGYSDLSSRPYVLQAWKSDENYDKALKLLYEADIALFGGSEALKFEVLRAKTGKLTIDVSERWLKRGLINMASPRFLRFFWHYYTTFAHQNVYKLCSSAFACGDHYRLHSFKDKCYKWGYFTKVEDFPLETLNKLDVSSGEITPHIMWCSRFLRWKHPELPVMLSKRLKDSGYNFRLDMFGSGEELERIEKLTKDLMVEDMVSFCGNMPNDEILEQMRKHEIFLFTSDKNEGWGAVLNESMANGCAVVASNLIGSVPFLIEDGVNGCIFKSENIADLTMKVRFLLDNPAKRIEIVRNAINTMRTTWYPANAARQFLSLASALLTGDMREVPVSGPCSKAEPI